MKENVSGCFFLNTVYIFTSLKTTVIWPSCRENPTILCLTVLPQYRRVTDKRTDGRTSHIPRYA